MWWRNRCLLMLFWSRRRSSTTAPTNVVWTAPVSIASVVVVLVVGPWILRSCVVCSCCWYRTDRSSGSGSGSGSIRYGGGICCRMSSSIGGCIWVVSRPFPIRWGTITSSHSCSFWYCGTLGRSRRGLILISSSGRNLVLNIALDIFERAKTWERKKEGRKRMYTETLKRWDTV